MYRYYLCTTDAESLIENNDYVHAYLHKEITMNNLIFLKQLMSSKDYWTTAHSYIIVAQPSSELLTVLSLKCKVCRPVYAYDMSSGLQDIVYKKWGDRG